MTPEEYMQMRPIINVYGETEQEANIRREVESKIAEYERNDTNLSDAIDDVDHEVNKLDDRIDDVEGELNGIQEELEEKIEELEETVEAQGKLIKYLIKQLNERGMNIDSDPEDD